MKKNLLRINFVFLVLLLLGSVMVYHMGMRESRQDSRGTELVILNEIEKLSVDDAGNPLALEAIEQLRESIETNSGEGTNRLAQRMLLFFLMFGILYLVVISLYIYGAILKPFEKLEAYAEQIAAGNLDVRLDYERTNYFGAFTWAFDHMREEILFAKKKEQTAIEENKTVIAALSHDIKTPIASIRACSEGLEANLNADYEKRQRYAAIIMKKCDEVTALVNDLVLHSLSELEKLEICCTRIPIHEVIRECVSELEFPDLVLEEPLQLGTVEADAKRLKQMMENLLNNARKYAPQTKVCIYTKVCDGKYFIHVKDHGMGILPEDMPFIRNRFYRGKNVAEQPGSGLGLYITNYLAEAMHGGIELSNCEDGLDAAIYLPLCKE